MEPDLTEAQLRDLLGVGYRYACALRVDPADAQDLVQEAWVKVSRAYGSGFSKAVLLRSIRNLHIDRYRHVSRFQHVSYEEDMHAQYDPSPEAPDTLGDPQLNRCLARLREDEREVLFLSVVEGYTAEEIASMTSRPRGTILSLIHRARIKLKNYLMDDESQSNRPQGREQRI